MICQTQVPITSQSSRDLLTLVCVTQELQSLLKPFEGELDVYPVSKDVGKVGNNSPSFIIPIDSKENKSNIANFFAKGASSVKKGQDSTEGGEKALKHHHRQPEVEVKKEEGFVAEENSKGFNDTQSTNTAASAGVKREVEDDNDTTNGGPPKKKKEHKMTTSSAKTTKTSSPVKSSSGKPKISATSNGTKSPKKPKEPGTQKITKFFGNSS